MPSESGRIRREIIEVKIRIICKSSTDDFSDVMLKGKKKLRKSTMISVGSLIVVDLYPDKVNIIRFSDNTPGSTSQSHGRVRNRRENRPAVDN